MKPVRKTYFENSICKKVKNNCILYIYIYIFVVDKTVVYIELYEFFFTREAYLYTHIISTVQ